MKTGDVEMIIIPGTRLTHARFIEDLNELLGASGIRPIRSFSHPVIWCATGRTAAGGSVAANDVPTRIGRVVVFVDEHLDQSLNLDRMAEEANLSKYHFLRLFRDEVGQTPWAYVRDLRIKKAKQLLEQGVPPVEAAVEAGFFDQSHLTKVLKEVEGKTPREYQAEFFRNGRKDLQE